MRRLTMSLLSGLVLLTATALAVAMLLGLPLALWLGHLGRGGFLAVNVSNVGRAVPTFALLALLVAADWPGLAEPVRQGILRLVAHLFLHRDAVADQGPPAAVAALWRPWRRMRLK